jgi:hypothetical protein
MLSLDKKRHKSFLESLSAAKRDYVQARLRGSQEVLQRVAFRWPTLLGGGLEPHFRVLFSAIFQGFTRENFHQSRNLWK